MHLRDYLNDIPLKALKVIADTLGITVEYRARIKLMNAIDRAFWDGTLTEKLMNGLSENHRRLLSLVAFSYNPGVSEQVLLRKMETVSRINRQRIRYLVNELIPLALIGGFRDDDNIYFCPSGIAEQVRKLLIGKVAVVPEQPERSATSATQNLLEDIFSFLARAYKDSIPLTLTGKVRKIELERIFSGSMTCSDPLLHFPVEHRNSFVIEYVKKRGLVTFEHKKTRAAWKLNGWLSLSMTERIQDIVSFALSHKLQDNLTIIALTGIFADMPAGAEFHVRSLSQFLHTETISPGGIKRLESRLLDVLSIFNQLGILTFTDNRFTFTETGVRLFRGEKLPLDENMGTGFTIQPNFDVIVGPELEPRIRFTLELFTMRKNRDTVSTYVITQKGVARAREHGMSTCEILRFFHEHSRNPIPQNVSFSIETWANNYGSIFFENVTLMRFRDPAICSNVIHSPDLAPYIMEYLSDTVVIVSSKNIPMISAYLKKVGNIPEAFGEPAPDSVLPESEFIPTHVVALTGGHTAPEVRRKFIFPQQLLSESDIP